MNRAHRLSFVLTAGFSLLAANLARMQILDGPYYSSLSEKNRVRVVYMEAARGRILDRKGERLAASRLSFNCSAVWEEARSGIHESSRVLGGILSKNPETLEQRFYRGERNAFHTISLVEDISLSQAAAVEERLDAMPGFTIETRPRRQYAYHDAAAHLVGYLGPMTEDEKNRMDVYGYRAEDWTGRDGVEKMYESYLRGQSGGLQMEVNNRGRFVRLLGMKEPGAGKDIQLTVDAKLQAFVQDRLASQRGAVIVMDLKDGAILALNSAPSFDPDLFSSGRGRKDVGKYLRDSRSPMLNRAVSARYPPGSIFKIVTALAALEGQRLTPATAFHCAGYLVIGKSRFRCWNEKGHGSQTMAEGFAHSCNVYFFNAALLAGVDAIVQKAVELGLSERTEVDLPGEIRGSVPSREWKRKTFREPWYDGETANLSIGQGFLQITPIEALAMVAAVATKGNPPKPHVIDKISGVSVSGGHSRAFAIRPENVSAVTRGLDQVIHSDSGTGRLARVEGIRIAGKTGTAQSGQEKTHAWFVGFAPEEKPKIALVVFLEQGGRGGVSAASLAGDVFRWLKENAYL